MIHKQDNYLPCSIYGGQTGVNSFELDTHFYFSVINFNGLVLLRSQAYLSAQARDKGLSSLKNNASALQNWKSTKINKQFYSCLYSTNNIEIGRSCPQSTKEEMSEIITKIEAIIML